jgi:predicted RNA-binding Zn-ribbon protein involved in translation (DUF1610 family)
MQMTTNTEAVAIRKCPKCGSQDVTRSQRVGLLDRTFSLLNNYPYRCHSHDCGIRFRAFGQK